ncbi:MAG: hypothetical protein IPP37_14275 [Saprospiraceae bacterium]|nr:hypothetical protein [Saprospiraceae bacterium]
MTGAGGHHCQSRGAGRQYPQRHMDRGQGWHRKMGQPAGEKVEGYPMHTALSKVSPDHPVILFHASGHALLPMKRPWSWQALSLIRPILPEAE